MEYHPSSPPAGEAVTIVIRALDRLGTEDRLLALRSLAALLGSRRASAVLGARAEGMSWQEIANRLGMSRQSVWARYGAEDLDAPPPSRGRRPLRRSARHTYSSCAAYKAVTTPVA